jgi:signal transduction histidine kinase
VRTAFGQLTIRTRLALLNATVFVVGNAALLTLIWVSVGEIIGRNSSTVTAVATRSQGGGCQPTAPSVPASGVAATVPGRFAVFEEDVMGELWKRCLLLLIMMGFLSLLASWWVARRGLARIARVTAAARGIEDRNLHARLSLAGPDDEAKELADTFDAMLDRLERSFTEQRRFTGHASHELRTPLTVQRTALEIPLVQGRVPDDLLPNVHRALDATRRSERLIAALLALAKGESGVLLPAAIDLAEEARTAIADVLAEAREADVVMDTHLHSAPVWGDPSLLGQLVGNLVTNGVRHNQRNGSVHIATGWTGEGDAFVEVSNTGPYVDESDLPLLCEPFQRGSGRRKGAGLGLSVVRAVTATHRGTMAVRANPSGGLTVRVQLPARHAPAPGHSAEDE